MSHQQPPHDNLPLIERIKQYLTQAMARYLMTPIQRPRQSFFDYHRMCEELRPGDVVLVEGRNRGSEIIKRITYSPWTHAALYVGPIHKIKNSALRRLLLEAHHGKAEEAVVIESVIGKGTIITALNHYQDEHMRICRPIGLGHDEDEKIIQHAADQLGKEYNVRRFLDLGRFMLKSKLLPRLWRSSLLKRRPATRSSQEICSTMLAEAFGAVDFPILPLIQKDQHASNLQLVRRNPRLCIPSDFDYSPYFNIIKYPIFKLNHHFDASQLPWDNEREHNDELGFSPLPKQK